MSDKPEQIRDLQVQWIPLTWLRPAPRNARTHSKDQISQIALSISTFGWTNPVLTDGANVIIAGHGRYEAAKQLAITKIPVIRLGDMTEAQKRAYAIADNRLAELAGWDNNTLAIEFREILELESAFDISTTGFDMGLIDVLIGEAAVETANDEADELPEVDPARPYITQRGDIWTVGKHRLVCGDALNVDHLALLMNNVGADMVFTDVPYNCPVNGHVCGLGAVTHAEFAMASGEMTEAEYTRFLRKVMSNLVEATRDGSIHFHFIDWRNLYAMLSAGREAYAELKNLCVWNKSNGGMGSLYRSKHELVAVFKNGTDPHINNVELGQHGRTRNNVWDYPGANAFGEQRTHLAIHPTVKPVKLVEDAILDCSNRGDAILDPFCGSGTTLIAAERAGRRGFGLEIEPLYVDAALRRYRALTGEEPTRLTDGKTLAQLE